MTQYFRYVFTVDNADSYSSVVFTISTKYGVVVHLNGQQVYTANLPRTGVNHNTAAITEYSEIKQFGSSTSFAFGPVKSGSNVIAVEVHRIAEPKDTTIDFDASVLLTADGSYRVLDGVGTTTSEADNLSMVNLMFDNIVGSTFTSNAACTAAKPTWTYNNDRQEYISSYSLTTGPSCNQRHPMTWTLEGSNDGNRWAVLHRVVDKKFLAFRETATYDFFNDKAYNRFRLNVEACNTDDIGTPADTCYPGEVRFFQLSEFGLYTKHLVAACPPANDFSGAVDHGYAYKMCPMYKSGRIQALCTGGQLGTPEDLCVNDPIRSIYYTSPVLNVYKRTAFSFDLTVEGLDYSCYTEPSSLSYGIQFDRKTGRLFGEVSEIFTNYGFTVYCTNPSTLTPVSTKVFINSTEKPGLPIWVWIFFAVIAVIIILVLVLCIMNRSKSRKNRGHQNLEKKISTRTSSKARASAKRAGGETAKAVKV